MNSYQTQAYQPIGGINREDAEDRLEPTQVRDARNILFERNQFMVRPRAVPATVSGLSGDIAWAKSIYTANGIFTFVITSTGKLYRLTGTFPTMGSVEITGAGTSFKMDNAGAAYNMESVNDVVMFGNNNTGMLRVVAGIDTYTLPAASNYQFVTSHLNRAVGAYKLSGAGGDSHRIGWSQSGDETLWTGVDSGTANLADTPDEITGLCTLHNVLTIPRRSGFILGFPTGSASPVYNFQVWSRESHGCYYPTSFAYFNNVAYFASQSNICTFNLQQLEEIGDEIREEYFSFVDGGTNYRGFISESVGHVKRMRYHLVPINVQVGDPHFSYDIKDKRWSRHTYLTDVLGGFDWQQLPNQSSVAVYDNKSIYYWTANQACEMPASLVSRQFTLGAEEKDMIVRRLLLKYRNGGAFPLDVTLRAILNETVVENKVTIAIGSSQYDQELFRKWLDVSLAGQNFQITLDIPAGQMFGGTYLGMEYSESSEFKGA